VAATGEGLDVLSDRWLRNDSLHTLGGHPPAAAGDRLLPVGLAQLLRAGHKVALMGHQNPLPASPGRAQRPLLGNLCSLHAS